MMNKISLLLAWRYLYGTRNERSISLVASICFVSILIGSCALTIIIAVMNGFEKETCKKLQGIHASISIDAHGESLDWPAINNVLQKEFEQINASTPISTKHVIIQLPGSDDMSNVVLLQAIDPSTQINVTAIETAVEKGAASLSLNHTIAHNQILIGSSLANHLDVKPTDVLSILFVHEEKTESGRIEFEQKSARVGGTFKTGIEEFDNHVIFCSFDLLEQLLPDSGVTQIDCKLGENIDENDVVEQLKKRLRLNVYSWKQLYPALVSALKLEKYAMFFILLLIILVASMNIISLLFMQIIQKRGDIAILKAFGMSSDAIRWVFIIMGMLISFIATAFGLALALAICFILKHYPFITLPDVYYVTHLPVSIELYSFLFVFLTIMLISFCAIWLATSKTNQITIASVLRTER